MNWLHLFQLINVPLKTTLVGYNGGIYGGSGKSIIVSTLSLHTIKNFVIHLTLPFPRRYTNRVGSFLNTPEIHANSAVNSIGVEP